MHLLTNLFNAIVDPARSYTTLLDIKRRMKSIEDLVDSKRFNRVYQGLKDLKESKE